MNTIAGRIREIRNGEKLTQAEFGNMLNVSQDTISLWENGKSLPSTEYIVKLAMLFHVSADYILGIEKYTR